MNEKRFLNVGGASKTIPVPPYYAGWRHDLLDIDPRVNPDICADARDLIHQPAGVYDAVYCAHNLEHYHRHDGAKVLRGFHHVLKPEGFAEIRVPNLAGVIRHVAQNNLDIDDVLYTVPMGPILVRDVIYGYHVEIEKYNNEFYAHKTGFSSESLRKMLAANGFPVQAIATEPLEIVAIGFKQNPTATQLAMFGIQQP